MDKRVKDKLVRSPGEKGGGQGAQKDLHPRTRRDETKRNTQERMERGNRKRSSSAGSETMERVGDREKWKDRPKPTVGCSANGRRRWEDSIKMYLKVGWVSMDWIGLAEDGDRWRALVNAVMNYILVTNLMH